MIALTDRQSFSAVPAQRWSWRPSVGQLLGLRLALHDHLIASGWKAWE